MVLVDLLEGIEMGMGDVKFGEFDRLGVTSELFEVWLKALSIAKSVWVVWTRKDSLKLFQVMV